MSFRVTSLIKYDTSRLKKLCFPQLVTGGDNWEQIKVQKAADKSFNSDGYKNVKILAFGDDLVKVVAKRMELGMVVAFQNLKQLDYSENSGVSLRIESEDQFYTLGKSADLFFCKGG